MAKSNTTIHFDWREATNRITLKSKYFFKMFGVDSNYDLIVVFVINL